MFVRRTQVRGKDGKNYSYIRLVINTTAGGRQKQEVVVDFGAEKRFPLVLRALAKFLGPAEWIRAIAQDELLVKLATKWDRLDELAKSMVRGIVAEIEEEPASRSEQQMIEQFRDEIDRELQGDVDDDSPGTTLSSAKVAR